jgi:hypothetical protein
MVINQQISPLCIDNPHALMSIFHELKMNLKGSFNFILNCAFFGFLVMQLPYHVLDFIHFQFRSRVERLL